MKERIGLVKKGITFLRLFFPLVLIFHHLKHNMVALIYWVLFFLLITDNLGQGFGLSYLFLSPEYAGKTSMLSFALLGFSFGGFSMAFHSYSYMKLAPRFLFLAMVNKPFVKFCVNNSLIPTIFIVVYLVQMLSFQKNEMFANKLELVTYFCGFCFGFVVFLGFSLLYFFPVNKNLFELNKLTDGLNQRKMRWGRMSHGKNLKFKSRGNQRLYFYIGRRLKVQQCRSIRHYAPSLLQSVFDQNRISTTVFEISTIVTFIAIGFFGGKSDLDVPAGVSFVLLLTFLMLLFSSFQSWFRYWTYPVLIGFIIFVNYASVNLDMFQIETQAYGMDYTKTSSYNLDKVIEMGKDSLTAKGDLEHYITSLNNWKKNTGEEKPMLIIVNTSGGGSRSAAWVYEVLKTNDSVTNGKFFNHVAMITGASGGMVGASFYRALIQEGQSTKKMDWHSEAYFNQISADLLNKMAFAASTNDLFFRYQSAVNINERYNYDRAMAFEDDLNENTKGRLKIAMGFCRKQEEKGAVPSMIFSPTIVNDGRRLLLSAQPLSFLSAQENGMSGLERSFEYVDGHALLGSTQMDKLKLSSALRMNATFPYVLPMTSLPTKPRIQVMDAGSRDNFGTKVTVDWLQALEPWIIANTSGVLIVQVRDTKKVLYEDEIRVLSFLNKLSAPVTNVFSNFPRTQDFDQDQMLNLLSQNRKYKMKVVTFNLRTDKKDRISLSWHLTENEKRKVIKAIGSDSNKAAMARVMEYITEK